MTERVAINQILAVTRVLVVNQLETDKTVVARIGQTTITMIGIVTETMAIDIPNVARQVTEDNLMVVIMVIFNFTDIMDVTTRVIGRPGKLGKNTRGDIHADMIMGDTASRAAIFSLDFVNQLPVLAFSFQLGDEKERLENQGKDCWPPRATDKNEVFC
jgi:hypothetical protein